MSIYLKIKDLLSEKQLLQNKELLIKLNKKEGFPAIKSFGL